MDDVIFAKARRKARISMWLRGSSLFQGLESSENGGFPPFWHREQKQKIFGNRDRKARKNSFLQRSNLPHKIPHSHDQSQHAASVIHHVASDRTLPTHRGVIEQL